MAEIHIKMGEAEERKWTEIVKNNHRLPVEEVLSNVKKLKISASLNAEEGSIECVFHSTRWRSSVQAVLNQMRGRYLPDKYVNRVGSRVCNCKEGQGAKVENDLYNFESCKKLKASFEEAVFNVPCNGLDSVENVFHKMFFNITQKHQSRVRFLIIMLNAIQGDYKILENKAKLTKRDKRQKYDYNLEVDLPVNPKYLCFLFGAKGKNIKKVCLEYNCEVRVIFKNSLEKYTSKTTHTTIRAKSLQDLEKVRGVLIEMAEDIVRKRTTHEEKVRQYEAARIERQARLYKRRQERRDRIQNQKRIGNVPSGPFRGSFVKAALEIKESLRDTYNVKCKHHGDDGKKPKVNVLQGGSRCVNCLAPYDKDASKPGDCRFHPGFVQTSTYMEGSKLYWTCCGEMIEDDDRKAQADSHKESGCETARHNWKLNKSADRRMKDSNVVLDAEMDYPVDLPRGAKGKNKYLDMYLF